MSTSIIYKLYTDIIPVKGFTRSIILDLTKNSYFYIPVDLYNILQAEINFSDLRKMYPNEIRILKEYESFLLENDLIFPVTKSTSKLFPKIDLKWENPYKVTNVIFDIEKQTSITNLKKLNVEIGILGVEALLIRCFYINSFPQLKKLIETYSDSEANYLKDIQIDFVYRKDYGKEAIDIINEISNLPIISSINIYFTEVLDPTKFKHEKISLIQKKIINYKNCGVIDNNIDSIDLNLISEAQKHNTCLNRKLSIDSNGDIKNCPAMSQSFGNIKNISLHEAFNQKDFKKYWNLTKDEIETCKDCEFRYICTDCRAYTERSHINKNKLDISKPLKCGYNPYTGEWEEWSQNPLKQKIIKYYGIDETL